MKNVSNNIIRSVKILGTGSYAPERIVKNQELAETLTTTDEWIFENLGIRERHIAADNEFTSDLAFKAAEKALENASLQANDIDLIIVATATPDRLAPSTACIVQEKLGAVNAAAFDVNAVCSGFLYAFAIGSQFIAAGMYQNVMVIGADTFSKITNWNDRSCVFFGDGAGATILSHTESGKGLLAVDLYADGTGKFNFTVPAGGSEMPATEDTVAKGLHKFQMNGKAVYDTATKVLPEAITTVLQRCSLTVDDVNFLIPHQPSIRILKKTAELLGLPFEKVKTNMERYANTSGGTIPILLDEVNRSGILKDGDVLVFAAVGSGWTWGSAVMRWVN
ncbi:3-oxoacyl-[acyl-carrier-protein] synthase 3 [Chryseobacterium aquaeductus]|uniref:Beta-ketoacyl-[acyl-carrier-protein] synthase III n=1 Tax=Chryseobacterium aquaeductus TaxID=2675056 RepID=A0A9N8QR29_9FLAO|nr:beta-ketoacyl-ACP synthase III [Chryseobacterium aquaeductus]CAA7331601.1 3-oxoacyl-[acyl-carrier-protein] synthase 3 [Chryseobacterium potabilaquae]CAD7811182.1 3-oxoacyl-[acyl-carrier-protein] synthase 3 [Chryseobacterium aquaeductus]